MQRQALLFVDQVDSTRLLSDIGDDAMVDVRRRLHRLITDAVDRHDGRVFGDMGDGLATAFASAEDAARAALEMQAAAAATEDCDEPTIRLRIGVHHGTAVPNGDGLIGMAVHIAARLCDAAPAGHVAASEALCAALGSVNGIRVTPFERRTMKGIAEPMDVRLLTDSSRPLEVPGVASTASRWRIPSTPWLSERAVPRRIVGRDQQRLRLEQLGAASDQRIQLVLVEGEPGVGKTTLLHSCGSQFADQGRLCVVGRADESQPSPYREFIEALAHLVPHLPDATIADHVLRHGHLLTRLVPGLAHRSPAFETMPDDRADEPDRYRLFEAITDLLRTVTIHQPMVLLLEDIHWSAEPSLALVQHLVGSIQLPSLLVIASFRPTEVHDDGPLSSLLGRVTPEANVTRIRLGPLGLDDVAALVADLPSADVAERLFDKTAGSPLFLAEMIRSFGVSGTPTLADDGSLLVPDTVQELATSRVDRLGAAHRALLADAAVLGSVFELGDIEALTAPYIDVLETLEEAEQAGVVMTHPADDRAFVFSHALVRDALYGRISAPRRRRRHSAAADAILAAAGGRAEQRAADVLRHIEASRSERPPELIAELARSAARDSMRRLDLLEAVRYRELVVASLRSGDATSSAQLAELAQALIALGTTETSAGLDRGSATFVEAAGVARSIERWDLFSEAASRYGGPVKENQAILDVSEPAALIVEALEHEPAPTPMRARLLTALAIWQRQHVPYIERRRLTDEALDIARSLDDRRTLATVLAEIPRALHGAVAAHEALAAGRELERLAAELGDDMIALQAINLLLLSGFELGWDDGVHERADQLSQLAERIGTIEGRRLSLLWRSTLATLRGDEAAHRRALDDLGRLIASFPPGVRSIMLGAPAMVLPWLRGQAQLLYEFGGAVSPPFARALFAAESGQLELAMEHIAEGGGTARVLEDQNYLFYLDVVAMTRTARRSNDTNLASELYDILAPLSGRNARMGLVAFLGSVDHHLGSLAATLGRTDDAVRHYRAALERHRRMEARPWIALTLAELAAVRRSGGHDDHETFARESRCIAEELELGLVIETLDAPGLDAI